MLESEVGSGFASEIGMVSMQKLSTYNLRAEYYPCMCIYIYPCIEFGRLGCAYIIFK